jgi:hypothetical protein
LYWVFFLPFPSFCATISLTFFYYKHEFFVSNFIFALFNFFCLCLPASYSIQMPFLLWK